MTDTNSNADLIFNCANQQQSNQTVINSIRSSAEFDIVTE